MNEILTQAVALAPKVRAITEEVLKDHIQRDDVAQTAWLAMISGRPVFYLGAPGVDKTKTIQAMLRSVAGAKFQEEMMPMLATGAQLVVESTKLKESIDQDGDKTIAPVDNLGGAAQVDIFFGDEIWKTDEQVLKVLFDLFNLDDVRYEGQIVKNRLMTFMTASNELPDPESKLYALWSRLTIRVVVQSLDREGKKALVNSRLRRYRREALGEETSTPQLELEDLKLLRRARPFVEVPDQIVETVLDILQELVNDQSADFSWAWADDRRFGRIFDVMQAKALLDGRTTVTKADLAVLEWLLWDTPEQIPVVKAKVAPYCRTPLTEAQEVVDALLAPSGTVEQVLNGDRSKGVQALTQCENAGEELKHLEGEATDEAMRQQIATLHQQVEAVKNDVIAVVTGTKKPA